MNGYWKLGIILLWTLACIFAGWHSHVWYEGYVKSKLDDKIMVDRIEQEKKSNDEAAKVLAKEAIDHEKEIASNAEIQKHIEADKPAYSCIVPATGLRDLQQAVTSHSRARIVKTALPAP